MKITVVATVNHVDGPKGTAEQVAAALESELDGYEFDVETDHEDMEVAELDVTSVEVTR